MWKIYNKTIIEFGFRITQTSVLIINNYSPKWRWLTYGGYSPSREAVRFQVSFEYRSRIKAAAWTLEKKMVMYIISPMLN